MKIKKPIPHIEEKHIKHSATFSLTVGTLLEAGHVFYPSGLVLLLAGGVIAVYEPYIISLFHTYDNLGDFNVHAE